MVPPCTLPSFLHFYTCRPRVVSSTSDVPHSSSQPTDGLHACLLPHVDRLGFPCAGAVVLESTSYRNVVIHPDWQLAMAEEIVALERTNGWDLVSLLPCVRPITCKCVYKVKTSSDSSLECYKAHLVTRGFQHAHGRDYDETFAPVDYDHCSHTSCCGLCSPLVYIPA